MEGALENQSPATTILEQILRWCIRVEHRFSGACRNAPEFGFSRWGNRALTSAAKAWPFLQPCYARLKACSTHHWIQKLWNCSSHATRRNEEARRNPQESFPVVPAALEIGRASCRERV